MIPDTVKTAYGAMSYINAATGNTFVIIIDEWDVLIREGASVPKDAAFCMRCGAAMPEKEDEPEDAEFVHR